MATYKRKTIQTYINISREEYKQLGDFCRGIDVSIGDFLASLIRQWLNKDKTKIEATEEFKKKMKEGIDGQS